MIAPFRFLAWLVLPALMSCSFNLLAATAEGAPQALHLLDYIGADYPRQWRRARLSMIPNTVNR